MMIWIVIAAAIVVAVLVVARNLSKNKYERPTKSDTDGPWDGDPLKP